MTVEPFAVLFWALGIVLANILQQVTQPAGLAYLNRGTGTVLSASVRQGSVRFILMQEVSPNSFPFLLYTYSMVESIYGSVSIIEK